MLKLILRLANMQLVFFLTDFLEVLDRVFRGTELGENFSCISDLLIPIILHLEDLLPDC